MTTDFTTPNPTLAVGTTHQGFTVVSIESVPEIGGTAYIMRHDATGARLMWLACEDTNRSFAIAFKTPPANHTGVFHILEHSVLCGSERFPVKEPFVTLLKSSMQTFLNALTFPDKTMYPVSSTNITDFENLMDVYLDAVLHPAIYTRPRIFEQEGWHYEYEDGNLVYNGVVFNEMKGALSDPDSVLMYELAKQLYPDNAYFWISGGDPRHIPELTYEEFIDTHARHYNLPNSYTILYGDLDIERELAFIAERFATAVTCGIGAPNALECQKPVSPEMFTREMATSPDNACVGLGYVVSDKPDRLQLLALDVLGDILAGSNEAPLKRRVLEEGLGDDMYMQAFDGIMQPMLQFTLRGARKGVAQRFQELVEGAIREMVEEGLPKERLEASLAQMEFNLREGDWGWLSDGVALSIQAMSSWLYDDARPLDFIRYEDVLAQLKDGVKTGLFERILRECVLENTHKALVDLVPTEDANTAEEQAKLEAILEGMSEDDLARIVDEVTALRAEQEAPDSPEAAATLPKLHLSDIGDAVPETPALNEDGRGVVSYAHDFDTHGILYANFYFDISHIAFDDLRYIALLPSLLGQLDTTTHSALELDTLIEANLGRLEYAIEAFTNEKEPELTRLFFEAYTSVLTDKIELLPTILSEVSTGTLFSNTDRIRDLLTQRRLGMEQSFANAGNAAAVARVTSYYSRAGIINQQLNGIDNYLFIKDLLANWDECADETCAHLAELCGRIFCANTLTVSLTATSELRERFWESGGTAWLLTVNEDSIEKRLVIPDPEPQNEAFCVPTNVCFVALGTPAPTTKLGTRGAWQVAGRALTLDYLWNEVRVKGGAYGCGFRSSPTGRRVFWSFRDPNTAATLERFKGAGAWLDAWQPGESELEGYIVATVADLDTPMKPRLIARRQIGAIFNNRDQNWRERLREQILATSVESLHELVPALEDAAANHSVCIFGAREMIEQGKLDLNIIDLF